MSINQGYLLVVEDNNDILKFLETTLNFKGHRVLTAHNGEEALNVMQNERPALIITDILMPKMDGFSLLNKLRSNIETQNIPVILISAFYIEPEDKIFAFTLGATRFIKKPINMEDFIQTIEELLAQGEHSPSNEKFSGPNFYGEYRTRIRTMLNQKNARLAQIKHLLEIVPEEEKPSFENTLILVAAEREEIRLLGEHIRERRSKSRTN
jgi:DNA-binding response OmpR family regulator